MKNVKKLLAFVLASLMVLSCLVGMLPVFAAEDEGTAEVPTPTYELDFTKYRDSVHESFYIHNGLGQFSIDDSGAYGYLSVYLKEAYTTNHFQLGHGTFNKGSDLVIETPANQMDYFVIKYKTKQTCKAALYTGTIDKAVTDEATGGYANGTINWKSYPTWNWNGLDEWSVQVVDASAVWGNAADTEYMDSFLFRMTDGDQQVKGADVKVAYIKFFDTKEDAEAFADSETIKKVEVEAGRAELNEGYNVNGQKLLSTGELFEMFPANIPTVGTWADYPVLTTNVSADAVFLGTGEIIDNTTEGASNEMFQDPVAGESKISLDDVVKVTDENTYIRFWGWTGQAVPAEVFGYQIGDNEPVFDEKFTVVDEGLAALVGGWGHPNAVRFTVSVPLEGLEKDKAYSVQLLVKHTDGTISSMKNGFKNFKVANVKYDYQDAEGKLYAFDGTKMVAEDGSYMYGAIIDGTAYATDGYFYPLTTFVPAPTAVGVECEVLEGVEHTPGLMVLPGSGQWTNWQADCLNSWNDLSLGWMHTTLELNGTFGADSGITKVGYQIGAYDPVWTDCDGTSYKITLTFPGMPTAEYMYQILVEKDGQTYQIPGSKTYYMLWQEKNKATHYEWDAFDLRWAEAPEVPEAGIGWSVNPYIYEAEDFAEGSIDVTIPTGERQYSWVTIKGMKGKVLTIDNVAASKFVSISDNAGNYYDFRKAPSYYGLAFPVLEDEYTVKIRTVDTSGADRTYTFAQDDLLLTPDALEGQGTEEAPYILKYTNNYYVMAEGTATFQYTATEEGDVSIYATMGTLAISTSSGAEAVDGIVAVEAGDVVTAVLSTEDGTGYVYAMINFTAEVEHTHTLETIPGVPATCVKEGTTDAKVCTVCGITTKRHEVATVVAHKYETVAGKDATCTETGLTEGMACSVCGDVQTAQETIKATGHTAGDWEIVTEAAVGVEGKQVKKCTVCATVVEEEAIAALQAPATDAPTTDAATDAPATDAPATTEAKGGCGSVIGMSAAAVVLAAAAAAVALKKKD